MEVKLMSFPTNKEVERILKMYSVEALNAFALLKDMIEDWYHIVSFDNRIFTIHLLLKKILLIM